MSASYQILDPNSPSPLQSQQLGINRRHFFGKGATGIGVAALASMLGKENAQAKGLRLPNSFLKPNGSSTFSKWRPTHVDTFDHKPLLKKLHGKPIPAGYAEGKRFSTMTAADGKLMLDTIEPFHSMAVAWANFSLHRQDCR